METSVGDYSDLSCQVAKRWYRKNYCGRRASWTFIDEINLWGLSLFCRYSEIIELGQNSYSLRVSINSLMWSLFPLFWHLYLRLWYLIQIEAMLESSRLDKLDKSKCISYLHKFLCKSLYDLLYPQLNIILSLTPSILILLSRYDHVNEYLWIKTSATRALKRA